MRHKLSALFIPPAFKGGMCTKCPHIISEYIKYSGEDTKIKKYFCALYRTVLSTSYDHSYVCRLYKCIKEFKR